MATSDFLAQPGLPRPRVSPDEAARIAHELYGVSGDIIELGSQQDRNFRIDDGPCDGCSSSRTRSSGSKNSKHRMPRPAPCRRRGSPRRARSHRVAGRTVETTVDRRSGTSGAPAHLCRGRADDRSGRVLGRATPGPWVRPPHGLPQPSPASSTPEPPGPPNGTCGSVARSSRCCSRSSATTRGANAWSRRQVPHSGAGRHPGSPAPPDHPWRRGRRQCGSLRRRRDHRGHRLRRRRRELDGRRTRGGMRRGPAPQRAKAPGRARDDRGVRLGAAAERRRGACALAARAAAHGRARGQRRAAGGARWRSATPTRTRTAGTSGVRSRPRRRWMRRAWRR